MNTQIQAPPQDETALKFSSAIPALRRQKIEDSYFSAIKCRDEFLYRAILCGQLIIEARNDFLASIAGKNLQTVDKTESFGAEPSRTIAEWLKEQFPFASHRTLHNWAMASKLVVYAVHGVSWNSRRAPICTVRIREKAQDVSVSSILANKDFDLCGEERAFREKIKSFISGLTLSDVLSMTSEGRVKHESVLRAESGAEFGGHNGESRKDFPLFIGRKLKDISSHLSHWDNMTLTQRNESLTIFRSIILGEEAKLPGRKAGLISPKSPLPKEICQAIVEACRERLKPVK